MLFSKKFMIAILLCLATILSACSGGTSKSEPNSEKTNAEANPEANEEFTPSEQIDMLVGYAAGGGGDLTARTAVKALTEAGIVEETMVVTNMPGASGALALLEMSKRKSDPHVLIQVPNIGEPLWQEGKVKAKFTDFTPIAQVATEPMVITVSKDSPFTTIEELFEALKQDPSNIIISTSSAIDGQEPFRWDVIKKAYGIDKDLNIMTTGGASESFQNLLGGHSNVAMLTQSLLKGNVENGNLKPLAVLGDNRLELFPDVPTLKEAGYDITYYRIRGFWAAGEISPSAVSYWENAFKEMTETEIWQTYVKEQGMLADFKGSEDYKKVIEDEAPQYQEYLKNLKQ